MYLFKKTSFLFVTLGKTSLENEPFFSMDSHSLEEKVRDFLENLKDSTVVDSSVIDKLGFLLPFFITSEISDTSSYDKDCMSVSIPSSDQTSMDFVLVYSNSLTSSDLIHFLDRFVFFVRLLGQYSQHYPLAGRLLSYIFNS